MKKIDTVFKYICLVCAGIIWLLAIGIFLQLLFSSSEAWQKFGLGFFLSCEWNPAAEQYGALPSIIGTLVTTAIALFIALPLAFSAALYLVDARPSIGEALSCAIDLLAAIPSVIYGMWGLFVLVPLMQQHVQPFIAETLNLGKIKFIGYEFNGFGLFTSGLILSIMILPYICAIMRNVFQMTPSILRESAYGVGCTRWETSKDIVLRYGARGVLGGIFVGLGRALGETMAVLFVIGNVMDMPDSIFSGSTTIASTLANNFAEAGGMQRSSLFALGLILLAMCLVIHVAAQYYLHTTGRRRGEA